VFTAASIEHLAERNIVASDVAEAVFGQHGAVRVRRAGRGPRERWYVVAPVRGGALITCVFRAATPRDLAAEGAFALPPSAAIQRRQRVDPGMRLCVTGWMAHEDEMRSYRSWRRSKGGR
jgi:hypothetical protein